MPRKSHWTWDRRSGSSPEGTERHRHVERWGAAARIGVQIQTMKESAGHPAQRMNQSVTLKVLTERLGHHVLPLWDTAQQFFTKPHAPCGPAVTPLGLRPQLAVLSKISEHLTFTKKKELQRMLVAVSFVITNWESPGCTSVSGGAPEAGTSIAANSRSAEGGWHRKPQATPGDRAECERPNSPLPCAARR